MHVGDGISSVQVDVVDLVVARGYNVLGSSGLVALQELRANR